MTSIDITREPYMGIYDYGPTSQQKLTMTVDKDGRPVSPVHVHVDDQTSVHVHMKKPKKSCLGDHGETKRRFVSGHGASNLRRTGASARARSKSPLNGPWVPPPGKSTKASSLYSWQGQSHRLEIAPHDDTAVRGGKMYELSTDEEDEATNKVKKYERKIDELMNEVGTLRNEMVLQNSARELSYKDDMLQSTNCTLLEKEAEIEDYRRELLKTERENRTLRQNMGHMQNEAVLNKSERQQLNSDRDMLMKKLVEVEMDGQAAAKQVAALRDSMQRLRQEKQLSSTDSQMLNKQKELLLERLMEFELTNRSLRRMLRERHEEEANSMRLREQRDLLLHKLRETEDAVQRLRTEVLDKSRQIADQRIQMTAQQEETMSISNKQVSLESTRAHLQKQLRQKEADCNRMAVQLRTLESKLAQERIEIDHLQGQVEVAREKADRDKDALKKAARVQKHRAAHSEEAVEQANVKLMERDAMMADMRSQIDGLMTCLDKISKEKSQALAENSAFKTRISELEGILTRLEDDTKNKVESATAQLHERTTEVAAAKLENERLKVTRTQHQADDTATVLDQQRKETAKIQQASNDELDKVKSRLQVRLQELEPIPEMLRSTELQLQEATEKLHTHEAHNKESNSLLEELTTKLELQTKDMDAVREKWLSSQDEVRTLKQKLETLEKKMRELEDQNREVMCTVAKKEETVHQANMRMDEHSRENASLQRQLETALCDARRLSETARDKISCRDRITQQRILDLEAQVNHLRTEVTRAKREKEEAERKFNSRLYDLKDRLEQAHSTNRSMQNYVQFLKNSYSNVFGDTPLMTTSSPFKTFH